MLLEAKYWLSIKFNRIRLREETKSFDTFYFILDVKGSTEDF